jgi:hypothetical protein
VENSTNPVSPYQVWLGESLAHHRRGRILKTVVRAQPADGMPVGNGIYLLFGSDFQEASEATQRAWITWSQEPGRVLLVIPPFKSMDCLLPTPWAVKRRQDLVTAKQDVFLNALASEVQYQLQGDLQIAHQAGGTWDDQSLCTAYYRKHPHSGIFAITCLPLWSLLILDWESALHQWLDSLFHIVGNSNWTEQAKPEIPAFSPSVDHFTLLLHLLTADFNSDVEALEALPHSTIFSLDSSQAAHCLNDLETHGLVSGGNVTDAGRQLLRQSQYAPYAEELEALSL